jgi:drug/metabolite transporter (DMT)-like permease
MSNGSRPIRNRSVRKPVEYDLGFHWGVLNQVLLGLGIAVLVAGYVALSRGSTTLAPVLLVLGYCGLIPASVLIRGREPGSGE